MDREESALDMIATPRSMHSSNGDYYLFEGPQLGGVCRISRSRLYEVPQFTPKQVALLRRAVWDGTRRGESPVSLDVYVDEISRLREPTFATKALDLLECVEKRSRYPGDKIEFYKNGINDSFHYEAATVVCSAPIGRGYSGFNEVAEVNYYFDYLASRGWVDVLVDVVGARQISLKAEGRIKIEETRVATSRSSQAFIAMWFSPDTDRAYTAGFEPAVFGAGYSPFRIDRHHHENRIDDEIISQIRKSRFLVADFTCGHVPVDERKEFIVRGGVYFEAGFAQGLGIPVIWTARADCLASLHFDTRSFPHILWQSPEELKVLLSARIEALIGHGPVSR